MTSGVLPDLQDRPDLPAQSCHHEAAGTSNGRGKLRTYLGIAPGVGKTYAMLRDGRTRRRSGVDAVVNQVLRTAGDLPVQAVNVGRPANTGESHRQRHAALAKP